MFSDTSTGMCCRPLWTAIVRPTMSGTIIERRDQVLIGLRSLRAAATWTFLARCRSTNGPFFVERGICSSTHLVLATLHDHVVRALVVAGLLALGIPAPRGHRVRITLAGLALATAVRVIDRVHGQAADRRTHAAPAHRTGLAVAAQVVFVIADFAQGRAAVDVHLAALTGLQTQEGVQPFAGSELHGGAGAAGQLAALAGLQFHVVHRRTDGKMPQGHRIARLHRRIRAAAHFITGGHALGGDDVAALAIGVQHQRNVRGTVRIVLDAFNSAGDTVLVALEVDDAVFLARTTPDVPGGDATEMVARTGLVLGHRQRL